MNENVPIRPGDVAKGEIELLSERVAWENEVARLFVDRVRFPAKENGKHVEREQFRLAHAAGKSDGVVVAPIAADDRILLVRQFRHPVRMWLRELPRGAGEDGEPPADTAARELREELGCEAEATYPLGRIANDSGQLAGYPYLFAARVREGARREPEETEVIERIFRYTFTDLKRACQRGEIVDSFTLATLVRLAPHFDGDRFAFRAEEGP